MNRGLVKGEIEFETEFATQKWVDVLQQRLNLLETEVDTFKRIFKKEWDAYIESQKPNYSKMGYTWKEAFKIIPKIHHKEFEKWMYGQTCAVRPDGETILYKHDVERFIDLKKTGRKEHPLEWD